MGNFTFPLDRLAYDRERSIGAGVPGVKGCHTKSHAGAGAFATLLFAAALPAACGESPEADDAPLTESLANTCMASGYAEINRPDVNKAATCDCVENQPSNACTRQEMLALLKGKKPGGSELDDFGTRMAKGNISLCLVTN